VESRETGSMACGSIDTVQEEGLRDREVQGKEDKEDVEFDETSCSLLEGDGNILTIYTNSAA
jgi:hypothetical protein